MTYNNNYVNTNGIFTSVVRTIVPLLVGTLVAWLATAGFEINADAADEILTTVFTALYYLGVRLLEKKGVTWAGLLLGSRKTPEYSLPNAVNV